MTMRIRKMIAGSLIAAALVGGAALPAQADTAGCVTRSEFRHVHKGMPERKVTRIFDTHGRLVSRGYGYESREYKICGSAYGSAMVDYDHGYVDGKWWFNF